MSRHAHLRKDGSKHPIVPVTSTATTDTSRADAPRQGNLVTQLVEARKDERYSVKAIAARADVTTSAIKDLERSTGPVGTLVAVMDALPFQVAGLAPGRTLAEQLRNRRVGSGMTLDAVAAKAALLPEDVVELENGGGSVRNLLGLLAVIAPNLRRRAPERAHWGPGDKADRDSRFTPRSFMEPVYEAFGEVDLDPCAHPSSPVVAARRFFLADGDDGLVDPWSGRFAFVNPPFSEQLKWLRRAHEQWQAGNVETILCLVPVRTDSAFFQDTVASAADVYLLRGRIPFLDLVGRSQVTPFSLMVVALGATAEQRARFATLVPGLWMSGRGGGGGRRSFRRRGWRSAVRSRLRAVWR